jgi:autotransporter-associated beta strand protein
MLQGASSELVIDVTEDANLGCMVQGAGTIVKKGSSSLILTSEVSDSGYYTTNGMRIEEGLLSLPQTVEQIPPRGSFILTHVYVGENGILGLHAAPNKTSNNIFTSLEGYGVVTCLTQAAGPYQLRIDGREGRTFHGKITGNVRMYSKGIFNLVGEESDFKGSTILNNNGVCGVYRFGNNGQASSIGKTIDVTSRENGGEFIYLGKGETTNKSFIFYDDYASSFGHTINGGENGGLIWAGKLCSNKARTVDWLEQFILSGDNKVPCEIAGEFAESANTYSSITKKGTGTWIFRNNANRKNQGAIFVDNGTLQFESIAEVNEVCSLGLQSKWYKNKKSGAAKESDMVDYAIRLGDGKTQGTIEYIGTERAYCTSRPIAVMGEGKLKIAEGAGELSLSGFKSATSTGGKLTLDVPKGSIINVADAKDGKGKLSIEKVGEGECVLRNDCTFSGDLRVNGGSLVLASTRYRWYRFTVMEKFDANIDGTNDSNISLQEFALYDKDGNNLASGTTFVKTYETGSDGGSTVADYYESLEPGMATYDMDGQAYKYYTDRDLDKLFDNRNNNNGWCVSFYKVDYSNPGSWIKFVIRMPENAPDITSYDFNMGVHSSHVRAPQSWMLEGSVDGIKWDVLHEVHPSEYVRESKTWMFDGGAFAQSQKRFGFPIASKPNVDVVDAFKNLNGVGVAQGATLSSNLDLEIDGLHLNLTSNGTLDGFSLAESGTVYLDSAPTSAVSIPVDFQNVTGIDTATKWNVNINGKENMNYAVKFGEDSVKIYSTGTIFVIR